MHGIVPFILLGSALKFLRLFGSCSFRPPESSCRIDGAWMTVVVGISWHEYLVILSLAEMKGLAFGELEVGGNMRNFLVQTLSPHLSAELAIHVSSLNERLLSSLCQPTPPVFGSLRLFSPSLTAPSLLEHLITGSLYLGLLWHWDIFDATSVSDAWEMLSKILGCEWVVLGAEEQTFIDPLPQALLFCFALAKTTTVCPAVIRRTGMSCYVTHGYHQPQAY